MSREQARVSQMFLLRLLIVASLAAISTHAHANGCPRSGVLGTSRIIPVDGRTYPRVGLKSFPQTLPLADKEFVLTFDDGPFPPTTSKVIAALANDCVHATFFLIGRNAEANPDVVKRIVSAGHSVGHHTWSHPLLSGIGQAAAIADIDRGIEADERALHGAAKGGASTLFFRFPGFASTPALLDILKSRGIAVFGADLWASDWNVMGPQQELRLLIQRVESARRGIILLHDTKAQTAAMLPSFLQYLRRNGYKIVHIVPATTSQSSPHEN